MSLLKVFKRGEICAIQALTPFQFCASKKVLTFGSSEGFLILLKILQKVFLLKDVMTFSLIVLQLFPTYSLPLFNTTYIFGRCDGFLRD